MFTRRGEPDKQLRVMVRAEGPTRVLTVVDQAHHVLRPLPGAAVNNNTLALPMTTTIPNTTTTATPTTTITDLRADVTLTGPIWEISVDLSSVGISFVGPWQEVAYLRLTETHATAAADAARHSFSLTVKGIQVDNPSPWVAFPVTLVLPAPASKLSSSVAAAVERSPPRALDLFISLWQRRPAGVLCVEVVQLQVHSVGVYLDQQHLEEAASIVSGMFNSGGGSSGGGGRSGKAEVLLLQTSSSTARSGSAGAAGGGDTVLGGEEQDRRRGGSSSSSSDEDDGSAVVVNGGEQVISAGEYSATRFYALPPPPQHNNHRHRHHRQPQQQQSIVFTPQLPLAATAPHTHISASSWHRQKIYMDSFTLSPIEVTLSFLSSPVHHLVAVHPRLAALQRILSLADVEDARLWLAGLQLANPLVDAAALGQALQRHYLRALLPELYKLVGSASMIGDPVTLLQYVGAGVWTFVAAPAEGLLESARSLGPRQFLLGVLRGTTGLLQNVVFAVSNAATKAAGAARKAIVVWGLDRQDEPLGAGTFRRRVMFIEGGFRRGQYGGNDDALLSAVLRGLAGLISEPIRGVEEGGLAGLFRGLQRGALGAVALPLAVLLEMSARFADSVRRAVAGSSNLGWLRPPRYVSPSEALVPYDWSSAMGRWLLTELDRAEAQAAARRGGQFDMSNVSARLAETFFLCTAAKESGSSSTVENSSSNSSGSGSGCYLVMTSKRVLFVKAKGLMWEPEVRWQAAAADLELVSHSPGTKDVRFVAHPPPRQLLSRASQMMSSSGSGSSGSSSVAAASSALFSFLNVECDDDEAAVLVRETAMVLMKAAGPLAAVPFLRF